MYKLLKTLKLKLIKYKFSKEYKNAEFYKLYSKEIAMVFALEGGGYAYCYTDLDGMIEYLDKDINELHQSIPIDARPNIFFGEDNKEFYETIKEIIKHYDDYINTLGWLLSIVLAVIGIML